MHYIGASTKMYLGYAASLEWLHAIRRIIDTRPGVEGEVQAFVIPSFPLLESALSILDSSDVWVGAQDCAWGGGALTGEVSPALLAEMGVRLVEIGHSERRSLFGETEDVVRRKTRAALQAGLTPLLCVGEDARTEPEHAAATCRDQVLSAVDGAELERVILAYEPVWAIGASEPAAPAYANQVIAALRRLLAESCRGARARIIYGGSAGPGLLPRLHEADGLFLGRFAHDPANFEAVLDDALGCIGG